MLIYNPSRPNSEQFRSTEGPAPRSPNILYDFHQQHISNRHVLLNKFWEENPLESLHYTTLSGMQSQKEYIF